MKQRGSDLHIDEDLVFQRREWNAQHAGRIALFAFVLAALLGFTGVGGPFSHGEAGTADGPIHVEYERIVRRQRKATLVLHLRGNSPQTRFWVSELYARSIAIESIAPEPDAVSVGDGRHTFSIATESSDVTVVIHLEHQEAGILHGEIGLVEGPSLRFRQVAIF